MPDHFESKYTSNTQTKLIIPENNRKIFGYHYFENKKRAPPQKCSFHLYFTPYFFL